MTQEPLLKQDDTFSFNDFNIDENLKRAITELGYKTPTAFQRNIYEKSNESKNIGCNSCSSYGKSLAFHLPLIASVAPYKKSVQAVVVCQTPLLAEHAVKECKSLCKYLDIKVELFTLEHTFASQILIFDANHFAMAESIGFELNDVNTIFIDGLSKDDANKVIANFVGAINKGAQALLFGQESIDAFRENEMSKDNNLEIVENVDQAKTKNTARHIIHQIDESSPKPRALLKALELHNKKVSFITCNEFEECELLSRFLGRYGYASILAPKTNGKAKIVKALAENENRRTVVLMSNQNLSQNLPETASLIINYDFLEHPKAYDTLINLGEENLNEKRIIASLAFTKQSSFIGPIKAQCLIDFEEIELPNDEHVIKLCATRMLKDLVDESLEVELGQYEELAHHMLESDQAYKMLSLLLRQHFKKPQITTLSDEDKARSSSRYASKPAKHDRSPRPRHNPREHQKEDESEPVGNEVSEDDTTRLYITLGNNDGFIDLASLAQYISEETGVDLGHFSGSGMVRERSAHIEVDSEVAPTIIENLNGAIKPSASPNDENDESLIICERARNTQQRSRRRHHGNNGRRRRYPQRRS